VSSDAMRVMWLYPDHMNIYADRGNIMLLARRCEWRGIPFELGTAGPGDPVDPDAHDLFYMGGGQDRDQALVARELVDTKRDALAAALESGAAMLAVCGGYQLLGHSYVMGDETLPGLGLADLRTVREAGKRLIGNVVIEADLGDGTRRLAGFENHGGRTYLGTGEQPLGRVVSGFGNNGKDGAEGVRRGRLIGTYLHGPLLPKNAWLADVLVAWALGRHLGRVPELEPLDDRFEEAAHESAERAALGPQRVHR
jgi:lipid II isoglutaminyl synthase (glutamine-hydrolysing)